jgi:repressor LexA
MAKLTKRREEIYHYIQSYIEDHGYPPAIREICAALEIKSPSTVHTHLKILQDLGLISMADGKNRSIIIHGQKQGAIPLLGRVTAGIPILAQEDIEDYIPMDSDKLPGNAKDYFALRVLGESMINAGILDGDIIIVRKQPTCENGEIAVAMIDGEATVKRVYREKEQVRLQPENDAFSPIYSDHAEILGKVVSLLRYF